MSDESEHFWNILRANFTIQANCSIQNYFSRQLTPKAFKERQHSSQMKKFTDGKGNNFSGWTVR